MSIKKDIVKKLTKRQIFTLCLLGMILTAGTIILVTLIAPEALPQLLGLLK